ncbi:MAG: hypothetical protein ACTHOO_05640 [Alcanivorax sp.]|jgi:uncharacterized protein YukE
MSEKQNTQQPGNLTLSRDTNGAVKEVMEVIKRLEGVYKDETEALHRTDTKTFMSLQQKKLSAAHDYQNVIAQIIARKGELNNLDPALKDRLDKLHAQFSDISKENMKAIERMQRCTEKLGNTIRNAAIRSIQKDRGYSYTETGSIPNTSRKKAVSSGLSETV